MTDYSVDIARIRISQDDDKTLVWRLKGGFDKKWDHSGEFHLKGNWESVMHKTEVKENILKDVIIFLQNRKLYQERGLPFRRTYLFHGPRGTGKLSLIHSLAGKLNYNICHLTLIEKDLTVDSLVTYMAEVPRRSLILIANVDDTLPSKKRRTDIISLEEEQGCDIQKSKISIMDFCNAIESFESETSPIVIMTAKKKEDIAPELFLPGRYFTFLSLCIDWQYLKSMIWFLL